MATEYKVGDRVVVPDPLAVNALGTALGFGGGRPEPHGPGSVEAVVSHPGGPLLRVALDSGGSRTVGSLFVKREGS